MIRYATHATVLARGRSRAELDQWNEFGLALVRLLEVFGEAATRVPADVRGDYPEVPWRDVVGMRNRLIHAYDRVDLDLVWDVVTVELSGVIEALRVALQAELGRADEQ
jgi:uncharacterized protein with HEPN domain